MRLKDFVKANRKEIDELINGVIYRYDGKGGLGTVPDPAPKRNDSERAEWVENDEGLYRWWKAS